MNLVPVKSTNISKIGYDEESNTLSVKFRSGSLYLYNEVPPDVHLALMDAGSKGVYLNRHIKNEYEFVRLT